MLHPVYVGCDVSKHHLDFFDPERHRHTRIDNSPAAITAWLEELKDRPVTVVLEATGRHDRLLRAGLATHGLSCCRVNPGRAREFAKALGLLAKTDAIDARMLALMGERLRPVPTPPDDPALAELTALHTRRDQLVAIRQAERVRLQEAVARERDSLVRHLAWLDAEIAAIEASCTACIGKDDDLAHDNRRLRSIPGVGPVTALTLLTRLPELGKATSKALSALAGLAPFNADSGTMRGQRHIRGGRKRVRDALYMAALVAYRMRKPFATFIDELQKRGKPFKVIIVALARKMLGLANALIRDQTHYRQA